MTDLHESIFTCPRCAVRAAPDALLFVDAVRQGVMECAFCEENGQRILAGRALLKEPTDEFPMATPPAFLLVSGAER